MEKYILGEISSSGGATLYKNPSDQTVYAGMMQLKNIGQSEIPGIGIGEKMVILESKWVEICAIMKGTAGVHHSSNFIMQIFWIVFL